MNSRKIYYTVHSSLVLCCGKLSLGSSMSVWNSSQVFHIKDPSLTFKNLFKKKKGFLEVSSTVIKIDLN